MLQREDLYTPQDHMIWSLLCQRLAGSLSRASNVFREGFEKVSLAPDHVPDLPQLNRVLRSFTGWQYEYATGHVTNAIFLKALARKTFLCARQVRSMEELAFCKLPDIFHDVYGHAAMLADEPFSDFLHQLGAIAVEYGNNDEVMKSLSSIYWYTAEVGLIHEDKEIRYYGGSIASSLSEIETVYSPGTAILNYSVEEVMNTPYDSYAVNNQYYIIDSMPDLNYSLGAVREILSSSTAYKI